MKQHVITTHMFEFLLIPAGVFSLVLLIYLTAVFLISQILHDNSIMDIAYGPAFAVSTWVTLYVLNLWQPLAILVAVLVSLWALRLGGRILRKNWGTPEDARYQKWRRQWQQRGTVYFIIRSYLQVNLLQGVIIVGVATPILVVLANASGAVTLFTYIGCGIFFFGLLYESIADWQLDRFIARKKAGTEPSTLMTDGLFRYSRRPNYFGETLIWWGLAVIAAPLPGGWLAFVSPLLITYIVTKVTGPMLEDQFLEKYPSEYGAYMSRTNYFLPWFPKQPTTPETSHV